MFKNPYAAPAPLFIPRSDLYEWDAIPIGSAHLPFRSGRRICARPSQTETFDGDTLEWAVNGAVLVQNTEWQTAWCLIEDIGKDEKGCTHLLLRMLALADER